ncbi:MAG: hypothetical protein IJK64_11285 [Clostridia bacterium]|nr:hypothetical protein [Clostridia bacterium]
MFRKYFGNPIFGDPEIGTLFDVYLTKQPDGMLRMDLSTRKNASLSVSFSEDGIQWSAPRLTLAPDTSTGWEDIVNRNCVLKIDGLFKMWYTGQAHGNSYIGYAESENGLDFRRVRTAPVLFPEAPFEGQSVMNPCVLYENGIYRMWYSAGETYEPNVLCYAESTDGVNWKKRSLNPVFVKNPEKEYEQDRIGGCQVLPHKDLGYLLFYIGYRDIHTACICCASSRDGVAGFRRCRLNPLVSPSEGSWDADACYKPSAVYDETRDEWRIWYNGRSCDTEYIGLAFMQGDFAKDDFE